MSEVWTDLTVCFARDAIAAEWAKAMTLARSDDWQAALVALGLGSVLKAANASPVARNAAHA
jgi:hypothetical protein